LDAVPVSNRPKRTLDVKKRGTGGKRNAGLEIWGERAEKSPPVPSGVKGGAKMGKKSAHIREKKKGDTEKKVSTLRRRKWGRAGWDGKMGDAGDQVGGGALRGRGRTERGAKTTKSDEEKKG